MYVRGGGYPLLNNGFTLIELLAVIVILAIIALIAVPIILNIIDDSKESAVLVSGKNYIRAIEQQILSKNIKEKFNPQVCIIQENGNLLCDGDKPFTVEVSGSKPTSGEIKFNNKKITEVTEMILDGYVLEMELNKDLIVKGTTDILEPPLNPQGTYLRKATSVTSAETTFLGGTINKSTVESIAFTYTNKVPSNAIGSWDASEAQDKSIMAWYTDVDNNNLYELYIGGEGGVKANPDSSYLFQHFTNVITIDLKYLDTSEVTSMRWMFYYCGNLTTIDMSNFNTKKVTDMNTMFKGCSSLTTLNLSSFDTSKVINMGSMFCECKNLTALNLNNFNTSEVTNMSYMFKECNNLINLDLSSFDTSKVTNMQYMFNMSGQTGIGAFGNSKLTTLIFSEKFNTSNVTNMNGMFQNCRSLVSLNLTSFNTNKVTDIRAMFYGCENLTSLDLSKWNTSQVTDMSSMFGYCKNIITINMKSATFDQVTKYSGMLSGASKLTGITVKDTTSQTFINARLTDASKTGVTVTIA